MKSIVLLLFIMCSIFCASAQDPAFGKAALYTVRNRTAFAFTVKREVNVRHYRIEASDDSVHFGVIATIAPKGNFSFNASYSYDLTAYTYRYYRAAIVGMNGAMPYSDIVVRPLKTYRDNRAAPAIPDHTKNALTAR